MRASELFVGMSLAGSQDYDVEDEIGHGTFSEVRARSMHSTTYRRAI